MIRSNLNLHLVGSFGYEQTRSGHKGSYDNKDDEDGEYSRHYTLMRLNRF
jgi:hypothetical protein